MAHPSASISRLLGKPYWALMRAWYAMKRRYRKWRIGSTITAHIGPQYVRSRDAIEIDITYLCNLRCTNCNRSITQAAEKVHMPLEMIRQFVRDSIAQNKVWKHIRVLGGEPTLHPSFLDILEQLRSYRKFAPACKLEVATNGYGKRVAAIIGQIPADVAIVNSGKTGNLQASFGAFNMAPVDDPAYAQADYTNGCSIMRDCGMGLNPSGYYPCAVAGGIDRVLGSKSGRQQLPRDADDMLDLANDFCRLCGHFKEGHMIPLQLRTPLMAEPTSAAWVKIYVDWKALKQP
jgi:hypothetical protein